MIRFRRQILRATALSFVIGFASACGGGGDGGNGTPTHTLTSIVVTPANPSTTVGGTVQLAAQAKDQNGANMTGVTFAWTSLSTGVATVGGSSGLVTGVAAGTAQVRASASGVNGSTTVTVLAAAPASVTLTAASTDSLFAQGATVQLTAVVKDAQNNVIAAPVTFTTSNPAVATVDATTGLVTAAAAGHAGGSATITATVNNTNITSTTTVNVRQKLASLLLAPRTVGLAFNGTQQLTATAQDSRGNAIASFGGVTYATTNATVATVSGTGLITGGTTAGTAKVSGTLVSDGITASDTANVTVAAAAAFATVSTAGLAFDPETVDIVAGGTVTFNLGATHSVVFDQAGSPTNIGTCGAGTCSADRTFPTAGTFWYHCQTHGTAGTPGTGMIGKVVVH